MASVALVVAVLSAAAGALGAVAGGMLAGMAAFVLFCQVIALAIVPYGIAPAFALATGLALAVQLFAVYSPTPVHSLLRRQSSAASAAVAAAPGSLGRQSS